MMAISTIHNLSRSIGLALLIIRKRMTFVACLVLGELLAFLIYKAARRDLHIPWIRIDSMFAATLSGIGERIVCKVGT